MRQIRRAGRPRRKRIEVVDIVGAGMLLSSVGLAVFLDGLGRDTDGVRALIEYADHRGTDPVSLISSVASAHRLVLLGDLPGSVEPKRIAAQAIESLARGPGLDAVVLEVGSDLQGIVDRYLESDPEDATLLYRHVRSLGEPTAAAAANLDVFRQVWRLNRELEAARRVRIIAADLPGWPPAPTVPPRTAALLYAQRDEHMYDVVRREFLDANPGGRVLFFVQNPHLLQSGPAEVQVGSGPNTTVRWLGARLRETYPAEVFSVLVDGVYSPSRDGAARPRGVSRATEIFRGAASTASATFALRVDQRFDFLGLPAYGSGVPGIRLQLLPPADRLRDAVDAYIYLGAGRPRERER